MTSRASTAASTGSPSTTVPRPLRGAAGHAVVLVHGSMDRAASFIKVTRRLPELEVVRYDRRGYGRSARRGGGPRPSRTTSTTCWRWPAPGPVAVVGHSLGGVIALAAAVRRPDVVVVGGRVRVARCRGRASWPTRSAGGNALAEADDADAAERFMRGIVGDERLGAAAAAAPARPAGPRVRRWWPSWPPCAAGAPYDPAAGDGAGA